MKYDFQQILNRKHSDSVKWNYFAEDILPMWVADMDFISPQPVIEALRERVEHGVFGYPFHSDSLAEAIIEWLENRFQWKVEPQAIIPVPGVVVGFNLATQAFVQPGEGIAIQTPVYMPFLTVGRHIGGYLASSMLAQDKDGRYQVDWPAFDQSIDEKTRLFLLCSPHNPVGRVWERNELERMAQICLRKGLMICSDEIHADLVYKPSQHIPIGSLDAEVARHTVTLMAPSKTFNIPGLSFSFAVATDPEVRKRVNMARRGLVGEPNLLGMVAAEAAYRGGGEWLDQVLETLKSNRDYLVSWIRQELPELKVWSLEGTYLAWIDCREAGVEGQASKFFMEKGKVGFNDGEAFGAGGQGFVRMNFACPRATLEEGLRRMKTALRGR